MIVFTVARRTIAVCGTLKESRHSNIVRTSLESNYKHAYLLFPPASFVAFFFSFFFSLSLSLFLYFRATIWPPTIFMRVMWGEITGGLITCWSCESRSRGNASTKIKGLRRRIVLTTDTLIRCKHLRFSHTPVYHQLNRSFRKGCGIAFFFFL